MLITKNLRGIWLASQYSLAEFKISNAIWYCVGLVLSIYHYGYESKGADTITGILYVYSREPLGWNLINLE